MHAGGALTTTVSDLRVEAQNYLLSEIFGWRRVPLRAPSDPSFKVTTIDTKHLTPPP